VKWTVGSSVSIRKIECQDIMEGSAPSETKEETTNDSLRAIKVGALTTLGTFGCTNRMVINLDWLAPYQGAARDEWP
jgi:hypothetical protein